MTIGYASLSRSATQIKQRPLAAEREDAGRNDGAPTPDVFVAVSHAHFTLLMRFKTGGTMGRRGVVFCGLLVAIGLACQPAQAGDRRSATRGNDALDDIFILSERRGVAPKYEAVGAWTAKSFAAGSSVSARRRSSRESGTPTADSPAREHRRLTLFHINSKFGDIAVEPVIGHVNGAQFSIGF
ncbi:MAG TPA: hypothetical protein VH207_08845 [Chthoniobacterales bacterium]|jgi:hypothetical protein|nr:hypothetical protein [Chthoniobacterales bacterium]